MAVATLIPDRLRYDIVATLARLRIARAVEDVHEISVSERRLDWLLGQIPTSTRDKSCA
jgi:hypothetical protein